jgi:hypothetical protein
VSWASIYAFWFGVWIFHTVPAARACDIVGKILLFPARSVSAALRLDQMEIFYDPISFAGTNGLILGVFAYCLFRAFYTGRASRRRAIIAPAPRQEAKVG